MTARDTGVKRLSRIITAVATASLATAPIAVHANTRAGDSNAIFAVSMEASHATLGDDETAALIGVSDVFVAILLGAWITGIVFIIADDDNHSSGAN